MLLFLFCNNLTSMQQCWCWTPKNTQYFPAANCKITHFAKDKCKYPFAKNLRTSKQDEYLLWCSLGIEGKTSLALSRSPRITRVLYSIKLRSKVYPMTLHENQRRKQQKKVKRKIIWSCNFQKLMKKTPTWILCLSNTPDFD